MKTELVEIGKQQAQIDTMKQTVDFIVNRLNELENLDRTQHSFTNTTIHTKIMAQKS